ncbi:hypothetical protein BKA93DRAFT_744773, partial [Sparassis latifolia]
VRQDWKSVAYAFFKLEVTIEVDVMGKHIHMFHCVNRGCRTKISRWLDNGNKGSTGNMRKHIKACWEEEALAATDEMKNVDDVCPAVEKFARSGSIMASFTRKGKGKVTYSTWQHSRQECRYSCIFLTCDVHNVFACCRAQVAKMLQEFDGELNFATDAWTLPNNKAIMLFMVHLHHKGVPLRMVLNVVEVAESHSSVNLAVTFAKMTEDFNITMKVCSSAKTHIISSRVNDSPGG